MTRLVWLIVFALLIGALVAFSLKTVQTGNPLGRRLASIEQARKSLTAMFPDSRFRIQLSSPRQHVRNLVVTIQPGRADSTAIAAQVDSSLSVVRRQVDLSGFESLAVAVFDSIWRTTPAR